MKLNLAQDVTAKNELHASDSPKFLYYRSTCSLLGVWIENDGNQQQQQWAAAAIS
jgi:hypothetical protein